MNDTPKAELLLGDALTNLKQMPSGSVDLVLCDPPYLLETRGHGIMDNNKSLAKTQKGLRKIKDGYDIESFAEEIMRLQSNVNAYFFCSKKQIIPYFKVYIEKYGCKFDFLSWHKTTSVPPFFYGKYLNDTEYILHFFKGQRTTMPQSYQDASTYFVTPNIRHSGETLYGHPTQKPVSILRRLIRNSSQAGDVVLDPFMGSGSTGEAAITEMRNFIGIEHDPNFLHIAAKRLQHCEPKPRQVSIFD